MQEHDHPPEVPQPQPRSEKRSLVLPLLIMGVVLFLLVGLIGAAVLAFSFGSGPAPVKASKNSVLDLRIGGEITEYVPPAGLELLFSQNRLFFHDYLDLIREAQNDRHITGIFLRVDPLAIGWAQAQELRGALQRFRDSGKWVVGTGEIWGEKEYYLASVSDEVYLAPEAIVMLDGMMSRVTFYKDALDWAGISVDVAAFKEYKNFADPYRYNKMSETHRQATSELLDGIYTHFLDTVSQSRTLDPTAFRNAIGASIDTAADAIETGLVDGALYLDQVEQRLHEKMQLDSGQKPKLIKADRYYVPARRNVSGNSQIALLIASGTIQSGDVERGAFGDAVISSDVFVRNLRKAREDDRVKAVVIRIDSPGGSALASDVIWREIKQTSAAGKPVIASMGTVAASGGYYMAMACDAIYAQPTTITGSIGVISMRISMQELYANLRLHVDVVKTDPLADFYDPYRTLTDSEREEFLARTQSFYTSFVTKAAQSRGMEFEELEQFARGRVWTGSAAHTHGLVDYLGGLNDAIAMAVEKAGLGDQYRIRLMPEEKEFWDMIREDGLVESRSDQVLKSVLPKQQRMIIDLMNDPQSRGVPAALMPFYIDIE